MDDDAKQWLEQADAELARQLAPGPTLRPRRQAAEPPLKPDKMFDAAPPAKRARVVPSGGSEEAVEPATNSDSDSDAEAIRARRGRAEAERRAKAMQSVQDALYKSHAAVLQHG
jgi:hypothetical protein